MLRAILHHFIEHYEEMRDSLLAWHRQEADEAFGEDGEDEPDENAAEVEYYPRPDRLPPSITVAADLLSSIGLMVTRLEKVRMGDAITRVEVARLVREMERVAQQIVSDPDEFTRLVAGWRVIRIGQKDK
jgi:hypothetical protein